MRQFVTLTLLLLFMAGCSTFREMQSTTFPGYSANQKLESARHDLEQDRVAAASKTLEELVAAPGVKGVTDEALFRLSVLKLFNDEKDGTLSAIHYLERLRHDYRDSNWSQQAKPLLELLNSLADLKKQNRNLKILNNSLTKDNKDLRQSIERLKNLDIQLERKTR